METFVARAGEFEGPLDLLLSLIEERKMHVSDVSIAAVADSFIQYVTGKPQFPVGEAAHFVAVASTLLLLKSRALLPVFALTPDEQVDAKDLERRLTILQAVRGGISDLMQLTRRAFIGDGIVIATPLFVAPTDMTAAALDAAAARVVASQPKVEVRDEVSVKKVVSLDEMIERLSTRIQTALSMSFREFSSHATDPREVVVGFLAMLELVKQGFADVTQHAHFDDITIEYAGSPTTPRY